MKRPKTKKAKLKLADSTLSVSEKLFLAPYLAVAGYVFNLDKLSFLIAILLSFAIIGVAVKLRNDALNLYDEVYSEETEI
ncbi:MAG TPA: hypothetical protein CFH84_06220 [Sulfurimonas sp. UBA12504]|nr:MAG: hypothetical protein A2019_05665 [Sulfurimonas sp. GWF2_37_8]DAB30065.1 MAG TPA: hypothetical protein CFH84_06220 [Sulfurimonas sp. UBA12504]